MFVPLEIFKGDIDTFMITKIVCFLGHNGSEDPLRLSQVHMIDETWDNWFNVQYNLWSFAKPYWPSFYQDSGLSGSF